MVMTLEEFLSVSTYNRKETKRFPIFFKFWEKSLKYSHGYLNITPKLSVSGNILRIFPRNFPFL